MDATEHDDAALGAPRVGLLQLFPDALTIVGVDARDSVGHRGIEMGRMPHQMDVLGRPGRLAVEAVRLPDPRERRMTAVVVAIVVALFIILSADSNWRLKP
jgi:hypothetical protein